MFTAWGQSEGGDETLQGPAHSNQRTNATCVKNKISFHQGSCRGIEVRDVGLSPSPPTCSHFLHDTTSVLQPCSSPNGPCPPSLHFLLPFSFSLYLCFTYVSFTLYCAQVNSLTSSCHPFHFPCKTLPLHLYPNSYISLSLSTLSLSFSSPLVPFCTQGSP